MAIGTRRREAARHMNGTEGGKHVKTLSFDSVSTKQSRIAAQAKDCPDMVFTTLHHHIDIEWMREAWHDVRKDGAAGVDGVTAEDYREDLEANLLDLMGRIKSGSYFAPPVRRHFIPKGDGTERPLGIPTLEDKVAQRAVLMLLEPIYERDFLPCSYGFRPGRSAHDALRALRAGLAEERLAWVIDADISKCFDSIDHGHLRGFLDLRINDGVIRRMIDKWLAAGVLDKGVLQRPEAGTPQGGVVSPTLANVFLHYVLDLWFQKAWRPKVPEGQAIIIRHADDFVVGFQHKRDAERCLRDLRERLARFGLGLHPEKTRLVEFGRFAEANRRKRGAGKPETFDFLGFTHFCTTTRKGRFRLGRKPIAKRMNRSLARIDEILRRRWHHDIWEVGEWLGLVCNGWLNYFAVPGSSRHARVFRRRLQRLWMRALRRRSQRNRFDWKRMGRMTEILWLRITIRHPWPDRRFAVKHPR